MDEKRQTRGGGNGSAVGPRSRDLKLPNVAGAFLSDGDGPIRLQLRPLWSASGRHDLLYLSSYLHDATFRREEICESGDRLIVPLFRQRWELPKVDGQEATFVRSEIQIGSVKWLTVEMAGSLFVSEQQISEFNIHGLQCSSGAFLTENSNDEEIVIDCTSAKLRVRVDQHCVIKLVDLPPKRKRPSKRRSPFLIRLAHPMG